MEREVKYLEEGVKRAEERLRRVKQKKPIEAMGWLSEEELEEKFKEAKKLRMSQNYGEAAKVCQELCQERMELSVED